MILIADASPLIALALCDCLDVLEKLFNEVRVSRMVYEEVTFKNKTGSEKLKEYLSDKIVDLNKNNSLFLIGGSLDIGEMSSMMLYKQINADYLLIDEKAGRRIAKLNDIKVVGSLGILIEAKEKKLISSIKPHIETLRLSKIHFSENLLNYAVKVSGESC